MLRLSFDKLYYCYHQLISSIDMIYKQTHTLELERCEKGGRERLSEEQHDPFYIHLLSS